MCATSTVTLATTAGVAGKFNVAMTWPSTEGFSTGTAFTSHTPALAGTSVCTMSVMRDALSIGMMSLLKGVVWTFVLSISIAVVAGEIIFLLFSVPPVVLVVFIV